MPRTGSSTAVVTSARSLSSAHESAASRGRIMRSSRIMIGTGSSVTIASGGLRMKRYTPMPKIAGPSASATGQQVHDRLHDLEVGQRPGDELAAGDRVEVAHLGGLDRVVEVGAQVVLELVRDAGERLAEREHEEPGEHRQADDPPQVIGEGDGLVDDAVVDHRLGEADHGDVGDAADRQDDEEDQEEPLLALEVVPRERTLDDAPAVPCAAHRMRPPTCHAAPRTRRQRPT